MYTFAVLKDEKALQVSVNLHFPDVPFSEEMRLRDLPLPEATQWKFRQALGDILSWEDLQKVVEVTVYGGRPWDDPKKVLYLLRMTTYTTTFLQIREKLARYGNYDWNEQFAIVDSEGKFCLYGPVLVSETIVQSIQFSNKEKRPMREFERLPKSDEFFSNIPDFDRLLRETGFSTRRYPGGTMPATFGRGDSLVDVLNRLMPASVREKLRESVKARIAKGETDCECKQTICPVHQLFVEELAKIEQEKAAEARLRADVNARIDAGETECCGQDWCAIDQMFRKIRAERKAKAEEEARIEAIVQQRLKAAAEKLNAELLTAVNTQAKLIADQSQTIKNLIERLDSKPATLADMRELLTQKLDALGNSLVERFDDIDETLLGMPNDDQLDGLAEELEQKLDTLVSNDKMTEHLEWLNHQTSEWADQIVLRLLKPIHGNRDAIRRFRRLVERLAASDQVETAKLQPDHSDDA